MRILTTLVILMALCFAQESTAQDYPRYLPSAGGEVIIPTEASQRSYDQIRYAPARRAGDVLYVSGAIVARQDDEGTDLAAFEGQVRRTLRHLDGVVRAAGATLDDVALIRSFHVWDGPDFAGTRFEQIEVIGRVWSEFVTGPHPAWTAVGTTGLLAPTGIVEIELTVHAPASET